MSVQISWNYGEFQVQYPSLEQEIRIGDVYIRYLLEEDSATGESQIPIDDPLTFFNQLYHHFLLTAKAEMRCLCLQALSVIYGRYSQQIGPFPDTKYIVAMLERVCCLTFLIGCG